MSGMLVLKPRALDNHTKPCTFSANGGNSGSIFSLSGNIHFNSMQRACCFRRTQRTDLSFYLGPIIKADKENEAEIQPFSFLPRQKWAFNLVVRWTLICKRWWHRLPLFFPSPSRRKCEKWRSEQHLGKKAFQWRTLPHKDVEKWCSFLRLSKNPFHRAPVRGPHTHTRHLARWPAMNSLSPIKVTRNFFLTVAPRTVLQILVYGWRWTGMFLRRKAFGLKLLQWTAENKLFNGPFFWTTETTLVNTQKATKKHHKDKPHLGITRKSPQQTSPYHTG